MRWSAQSSRGLVRPDNEDSWIVRSFQEASAWLAMVADGIGGYDGGEVASAMAVRLCTDYVLTAPHEEDPETILRKALAHGNQMILKASLEKEGYPGMGTTLTGALVREKEGRLYVGHVGDSRAYIVSGTKIRQITDDHSITGELVRKGTISEEDAMSHPGRNVLTMALGTQDFVTVSTYSERLCPGDIVLLCTDGLTSLVNSREIVDLLDGRPREETAEALVDMANSRGGYDNITVVLLWPDVSFSPGR